MILVTGGNGQLATCLTAVNLKEAKYLTRSELDITNFDSVEKIILELSPQFIINCAAYTHVDLCESNQDQAYAINRDGAKNLAAICEKRKIKLIHISTDYVFDGSSNTPLHESANCNPQSIYGKSKLAGEAGVLTANPNALIIRTSWLYSEFGNNFVTNMTGHLKTKKLLRVVYDQVGSPTYAMDLALFIKHIIDTKENICGLLHYANTGVTSWYDLTIALREELGLKTKVNPIESHEYPLPAPRPKYSVFATDKAREIQKIPHWYQSLRSCVQNIEKGITK